MKTFTTYNKALKTANEMSAKELRSISIWQRYDFTNQKYEKGFMIFTEPNEQKHLDKFIMLVTNFKSPYGVHFISPKSGEHWQFFPTQQQAQELFDAYVKLKYHRDIYKLYVPKADDENFSFFPIKDKTDCVPF
jgi:hypothetical protein